MAAMTAAILFLLVPASQGLLQREAGVIHPKRVPRPTKATVDICKLEGDVTDMKFHALLSMMKPLLKNVSSVGKHLKMAKSVDKHSWNSNDDIKYLDYENRLHNQMGRVNSLSEWLKGSPQHVLDIGSGPGYFVYALRQMGHDAMGMDPFIGLNANYLKEVSNGLDIPVHEYRVHGETTLPRVSKCRFDIVTAYEAYFPEQWDLRAWQFFLTDLACNQLTKNGKIHIQARSRHEPESKDFRSIREWIEKISKEKVTVEKGEFFEFTMAGDSAWRLKRNCRELKEKHPFQNHTKIVQNAY